MLRGSRQFNLSEIEERVLKFWKDNRIFEKSTAGKRDEKPKVFRFFEGPPTANGRPGVHHAESRAFKDIILRYKTMRGYHVPRRAGWDTHGLPVEIEVEKELGIKNKQDIEKFGVAEFNAKAKASVWKYKSEWERFTERIGFWLDMKNPYVTYDNKFIESLWWVLTQIAKKGFLKKLYKVIPWCPRCQTPLSSHELAQPGAYQKTKDPSLYVKFALRPAQGRRVKTREFLLVWTTTPWTLPANVAVAVNPKLIYTKFKIGDEYLWSFNPPPKANDQQPEVTEKMSGKKLIGLEYEPLYRTFDHRTSNFYKVIGADFVSTEEGTGLVHIAPAFGEDDLRVISNDRFLISNIPITIDDRGFVTAAVPGKGKFIKEADKDIVADLKRRGLMHSFDSVEHDYPFCWRCSSPLIYFARSSWFIEMSRLRDKLLAANKKINWIPGHLKEGRFGEWLREIKDWNLSRERYWGTPLPIWTHGSKNECDEKLVIGSLDDLNKHAYSRNTFFLVRHTESGHNVKNIFAGPENHGDHVSRLTELGTEQAKKIALKLKKAGIAAIYASPYRRTKEVAKVISEATGIKVVIDERLGELNPGIFSGRPIEDYRKFFTNPVEKWYKTPPGGENWTDARKRMMMAVQEINAKFQNKKIVIVSHGDPLWVLEAAMKGIAEERIREKVSYIEVGEFHKIEFNNWPYDHNGELDVHKPFVDEIYLKCPECGGKLSRVKEVADVWFDSGAMPFAQSHYPFDKHLEFPADYITEAIDQTRGWFYTLLAVSVLLGKGAPYLNVISLGHVLDKHGQKMSKSKGNTVDPMAMMKKYGADVLRWYFYTINPPSEPKRFDEQDLSKMYRKLILLLYNSFVFYETYAASDRGRPIKLLDDWILLRLNELISAVTKHLDKYEIGEAGRLIEVFLDDLSRWYIRRSRKNVSPKTLYAVLLTLSKILAPFIPFFAEALYQSLPSEKRQAISVHLESWPIIKARIGGKSLLESMTEVRRLASLALAEREKTGIKVRQPLAKLKVKSSRLKVSNKELLNLLAEEVNVKKVWLDNKLKGELELDTKITPELRNEGIIRELTRLVQGLRHDAGYKPDDAIYFAVEAPPELRHIIETNLSRLKKYIKAKTVDFKRLKKFDAELSTKIGEWSIWLAVKK